MPTTAAATKGPAPTSPHRHTADERRAEIVEAAIRAFASGGLAGTSTEEIARLAGVSQPYLFRLFGTKRDLFLAAVARTFDRVGSAFDEAARHPVVDPANGFDPTLLAIGRAYGDLLADRSLLLMQLHAFAACDDPEVRALVRRRFSELVTQVASAASTSPLELRTFFAEGMLLIVAAAMELTEADVAWQRICEGGPG